MLFEKTSQFDEVMSSLYGDDVEASRATLVCAKVMSKRFQKGGNHIRQIVTPYKTLEGKWESLTASYTEEGVVVVKIRGIVIIAGKEPVEMFKQEFPCGRTVFITDHWIGFDEHTMTMTQHFLDDSCQSDPEMADLYHFQFCDCPDSDWPA